MESIKKWKIKVKEFNSELNKKLVLNSNIKDLHYGFEVFDGRIIEQPKILFIGINPGKGNGKRDRNIFDTERISYLDVYNSDYKEDYINGYHLAEKTIKFFKLINWGDNKIKKCFEKDVMKTNFYHLATEDISDLKSVLNNIGYKNQYFKKSAEFSIQLINILKPKILILEGKSVFDNIVKECYEKNVWNSNKYGYLFDEQNNTHIIGYSRGRDFTNENRSHFINKLKEICLQSKV